MQPYYQVEKDDVIVAPSNISGLGVYAARDFRQGDILCQYSGTCFQTVEGNSSHYLLTCKWWDAEKKKHETWYVDGEDMDNTCGRYINDARGTKYRNNCGYKSVIPKNLGIAGKYYVNVFAIEDIAKGTELLASYGDEYWKNFERYGRFTDPQILTAKQYDEYMKKACAKKKR